MVEVKTGKLRKACNSCYPAIKTLGLEDGSQIILEAKSHN